MMRLVTLMGDTYAGKTTHGKRLIMSQHGLYISSGDIARSLMDDKTVKEFSKGRLSPHGAFISEKIESLLLDAHSREIKFVVLDGYPRTLEDRTRLETWCALNWPWMKPCGILLDVPVEIIKDRIIQRGRDAFDTPEVAMQRHDLFVRTTLPVFETMTIDKWVKFSVKVKREAPIEKVHETLLRAVRAYVRAHFDDPLRNAA